MPYVPPHGTLLVRMHYLVKRWNTNMAHFSTCCIRLTHCQNQPAAGLIYIVLYFRYLQLM